MAAISSAAYVRLRSCSRGSSHVAWYVNTGGYLNNNNANNSYAAQPDCACQSPGKRAAHSAAARGEYDTRSPALPSGKQRAADAIGVRPGIAVHGRQFYQMDEENIIGYEALWDSMMKCKRGVIWKDSVANFVLNGVSEIAKLSDELHSGEYRERPHRYFTIKYPKEREIMSISFRDRVYQRCLNDVAIYPVMSRSFIYDNCACQKGKGSDFARQRLKCHIQRYYRRHGADGYVLKLDVRKYYDSMLHDTAKALFRQRLPENVYQRAAAILDGFPGGMGFNPGSQIIQILGISLPDRIDHYAKERLRIKHYIRYMDDTVILGRTRAELETVRDELARKYDALGLSLHDEKSTIAPLRQGVRFLGYHYRLTDTGKVVMSADPDRLKATRCKYRRLAAKCKAGKISRAKVDESYQCWRECASKGDGRRMLWNMDKYYQSLWKGGEAFD